MTTTATKTRPIIFTGESVRAILAGAKTQTRRVVKPQPDHGVRFFNRGLLWHNERCDPKHHKVPFNTGDRLWVRETWQVFDRLRTRCYQSGRSWLSGDVMEAGVGFKADTDHIGQVPVRGVLRTVKSPWRSPIYMPRWASRITLEVVAARVERVQEISEDDAIAEGMPDERHTAIAPSPIGGIPITGGKPRTFFMLLWNHLNAKRGYSWESNPWVFVVEFKRLEQP